MRASIQFLAFALFAVSMAYAQTPTNGLVAYYPFNGNANDLSGNGNNGTVIGAILTSDRYERPASAYFFDGTSSYISVPDNNTLDFTNTFSLCAWIRPDTARNEACVLGKPRSVVGTGFNILLDTSIASGAYNVVYGMNDNALNFVARDSTNIPLHLWTFVVTTYDGSNAKIYVNGILKKDTAVTITLLNSSQPLNIGWEGLSGFPRNFKGALDNIRLYNRSLSASEISNLFNEISPITMNKTGLSGSPASFSVDSTFNSVVGTFNTSVFSNIDTLYLCYETANLTYLTQRPDMPANYTVNVGGAVADFGNNISTGTFSQKFVNITALKALSANFQITFSYTGGGGEIIFANPHLLVYGTQGIIGAVQKAIVRPQSLMKASAFPNPLRTTTTINYSVPSALPFDISIYDADGKLIKNVFRGVRQPGLFSYVWNGTNLSGAAVANGNYFFRVRATNGQQISEQIVVLK